MQFVTLSPKKPLLGRGYVVVVVVVAIKRSEIKNPNVVSFIIQSVCRTIQHVNKTRVHSISLYFYWLMGPACSNNLSSCMKLNHVHVKLESCFFHCA